MRYISFDSVDDWSILALLLGLSNYTLKYINERSMFSQAASGIVTEWLEGGSASWAVLVSALRDPLVHETNIAYKIAEDHPKGICNNNNSYSWGEPEQSPTLVS